MADDYEVLYVEDEPDIRALMDIAVEGEGIVLRAFGSGAEALASASILTPSLLLLDVMMPDMDGPETLARLRERQHLANVPAVFMTAKAQPEEIRELRALGAVEVIVKPFDPLGIAERLRRIIEHSA